MSAIFGVLRFDGAEVSTRELERMANVLAHRGPDGRRFVAEGPVGLGHCLLRVNQEDLFEAQPIRDAQADLILVADCRIDNREQLAAECQIDGEVLRDMPDSALILHAYQRWGEAAPEHLIGDFAYAVWDGRARKLVLARDHMGQRYVFYHHAQGFLAFSTEIKGLWAVEGTPRQMREAVIGRRLLPPGVPLVAAGGTLFAGIQGVRGGTSLSVTAAGEVASRTYWRPHADPAHERRGERYYVETYRAILDEAVACRLRRLLRPAALMLSGGFDSAAIAGLAGPVVSGQRRRLLAYASVVSEAYLGSVHDIRCRIEACRGVMPHLDIRYVVAAGGAPLDDLEQRFTRNDGLSSIVDHVQHAIFAQAAGAGARLLLDGVGGDFTVNPRGRGALAQLLRTGRFRRLVAEIGPAMQATGQTFWQVLKRELITNLIPRRLLNRLHNGPWRRPAEFAIQDGFLERLLREGALGKAPGIDPIPVGAMRALSLHAAAAQAAASRPTRAIPAASFGLELSRPFLDKRVVEFGLAIPDDLYVKRGRARYLARTALADLYPPELLTRMAPNERPTPEAPARILRAMPQLLAEAERLSANPKLAAYVDFAKLRTLLLSPGPPLHPKTMRRRRVAIRALMIARQIEWFGLENRLEPQGQDARRASVSVADSGRGA
jgi:asparagine synthase (glutamine-hydrolysing)